jgi:hypothetical protein
MKKKKNKDEDEDEDEDEVEEEEFAFSLEWQMASGRAEEPEGKWGEKERGMGRKSRKGPKGIIDNQPKEKRKGRSAATSVQKTSTGIHPCCCSPTHPAERLT